MKRTDEYEFYKFDFKEFNPIQEACYSFFTEDCNLVVASAMASGIYFLLYFSYFKRRNIC